MENTGGSARDPRHPGTAAPSPWVCRFAPLVPRGGVVLDLACGGGRHARHFLDLGYRVVAVDRELAGVADLRGRPAAEVIAADLEGAAWPLAGRRFSGVVVANYLHRPLFPVLLESLASGGVLIYETFARGNQRFGPPRNPDYLLRGGELLEAVRGRLQVVAYEHGILGSGAEARVVERLAAVNDAAAARPKGEEPEPRPLYPAAGSS